MVGLSGKRMGLAMLLFGLTGWTSAYADLIAMAQGDIEGRVLENSARVYVIETVAGEYVVVQKKQVKSYQQETEPDFYFRRGRFYEAQGNEQRAVLNYLEALNRNPEYQPAKHQIEEIQHQKKQEQLQEGIDKAESQVAGRNYWKALDTYQSVLDMEPEDQLARDVIRKMSDTHARIAFLFYDHCADEDAVMELAKAEELNPNSAEIYYILGRIHESDRKFDLARLEYERALEIDPNHSRARSQLNDLIERQQERYAP